MADSATQSTDSPNQPKFTDSPKKPNSKRKKRSKTTNSPSSKLAVSSNQSKVKNPPNLLKSTDAPSQPASKRKKQPKTTNSLKFTDPQPRIESTDSPTKSPIHPPSGNSPRPNSKKKKKLSKSAKLRLRAQQINSPAQPTDSAIQPSNAALATQLPSPDSSARPKSKRQKLSKTTKSRSRAQQIDSPTQPDGSPIQPTSADSSTQPAKSKREKFKNSKSSSLRARMLSRLSAARFRFINQELYTWDGQKSTDLAFAKDPKTFEAYHSGFRQQAKLWPLNPIDSIIKSIRKMADFQNKIIADFGCGEAKLALELSQNKVYSFDLVALNDRVTVADNANTNLYAHSVDIAVHCLSLMSSKISAYLREANRVLKVGGILKIAEVESRFEDVDKFVDDVAKFNFRLARKDLSKNLFYFLDFEKTADIGLARKRKLPNLSLLPCMYKKR
ncbi:unnamed protein product [Nesidiocoris tenuis]|uniref:Ribosomal RNA-processing protein 8 n=1 Tax=Nesidiocoris tenuis TaxID=355587 RepID=A0A6H5HD26_9HEMI|nr:unnamed protein product [Nesidiocoris tenuis]